MEKNPDAVRVMLDWNLMRGIGDVPEPVSIVTRKHSIATTASSPPGPCFTGDMASIASSPKASEASSDLTKLIRIFLKSNKDMVYLFSLTFSFDNVNNIFSWHIDSHIIKTFQILINFSACIITGHTKNYTITTIHSSLSVMHAMVVIGYLKNLNS